MEDCQAISPPLAVQTDSCTHYTVLYYIYGGLSSHQSTSGSPDWLLYTLYCNVLYCTHRVQPRQTSILFCTLYIENVSHQSTLCGPDLHLFQVKRTVQHELFAWITVPCTSGYCSCTHLGLMYWTLNMEDSPALSPLMNIKTVFCTH